RPAISFSTVDFPQPDGPRIAISSPTLGRSATWNVTLWIAVYGRLPPNVLVTSLNSTTCGRATGSTGAIGCAATATAGSGSGAAAGADGATGASGATGATGPRGSRVTLGATGAGGIVMASGKSGSTSAFVIVFTLPCTGRASFRASVAPGRVRTRPAKSRPG